MLRDSEFQHQHDAPVRIVLADAAAPKPVVIHSTQFLVSAHFQKVGSDLVLTGENERSVVLANYFNLEHKPALISGGGALLSPELVEKLAGSESPNQYAQVGAPAGVQAIGRVERVGGTATVQHANGVVAELKVGDPILQGDVVQTGDGSLLGLSMSDGTAFNMGAGARMVINELIYAPNDSSNSATVTLLKGSIAFVAGQIAKTGNMKIETPVSSMGIRGTTVNSRLVADINGNILSIDVSLMPDPDGHSGFIEVYDLSKTLIATITTTSTSYVFTPTNNLTLLAQATQKTPEQVLQELQLAQILYPIWMANPANNQGVQNLQTKSGAAQDSPNPLLDVGLPKSGPLLGVTPIVVITGFTIHNDGTVTNNQQQTIVLPANLPPGINASVPPHLVEATINDPGSSTSVSQLTITDLDGAASYDISAMLAAGWVQNPNGTLSKTGHFGTATLNPSNGTLTYQLDNVAANKLGDADHPTESFVVQVRDDGGLTASTTVVFTIDGADDAPTVKEIADHQPGENAANHELAGTVDAGAIAAQQASFLPQGQNYLGDFNVTVDSNGTVHWTFHINDSALDFLQDEQELIQNYVVTISGSGGQTTQTITVLLHGAEDDPVVTSGEQSGLAQEIVDNGLGENATLHQQSGAVTFTDVDDLDTHTAQFVPGGNNYLGTFALDLSSVDTGNGGTVGWAFEVEDSALDFLQQDQVLVQTYTVTIDDGHGGQVPQTVTITITGTEDIPVITSDTQSGSVKEIADNALGENATLHQQSGTITFNDVDDLDLHTAGYVAGGVGYLGTFTLDLTNIDTGNGGTVGWTFNVEDSDLDFLQQDQVLVQTYTVTIDDGHGGQVPQTVTITITGTEDVPVIESATLSGSATEIADHAVGENATLHQQSGAITFSDVDDLDLHTAGHVAGGVNYLGTFTLDKSNVDVGNGGTVGWTFEVEDSALDFLQQDQVLVQTYTVTIDDGHGGQVPQTVTITITGTEDIPVITSDTQSGTVIEIVDNAPGENTTLHEQGGAITFTDVDDLDTHQATFVAGGDDYLGTFALDLTDIDTGNGGTVGWTFNVEDSDLDFLQQGQVLVQTYTVTIDDGHGGQVPQVVTITIKGTEDIPVVTSDTQSGSVTEIIDNATGENATLHQQAGSVTFTDVDDLDTHIAIVPGGSSYLGTFNLDKSSIDIVNGGTVGWTFEVEDGDLDFLQQGQVLTQTYIITVDDLHGGQASQTVTITIKGTEDVPVIESATLTGAVIEIADHATGENATLHQQSGAIAFSDVDDLDLHTAGYVAGGVNYLGTFKLDTSNIDTGNGGTIAWTFEVEDSDLDFLQKDQILVQTYTITVDDLHGGQVPQTVTITITGTEDVPVIETATLAGSVKEIVDHAAGENATLHQQSGVITFSDVDDLDAHTAGYIAGGANYLGAFALDITNIDTGNGGTVGWTFSVQDGALDFLQQDQTLVQTYTVTVDDGHGGQVPQTVTITIKGTEDIPVIESATLSGSVTEIADGAGGENATLHQQSGAIAFSDVDNLDLHTANIVADGSGYVGTLTLDLTHIDTGNGGSVGWTFSVQDSALDVLQQGQVLTQTYTITVDDGHGGQVPQTVTITLTGASDESISFNPGAGFLDVADTSGNLKHGTLLGSMSVDDANSTDPFTYTLGAGSATQFTLQANGQLAVGSGNVSAGTYVLNVVATNQDGSVVTTPITVFVGENLSNQGDVVSFSNASGPVIAFGLNGDDTITGSNFNDAIVGGKNSDTLIGGGGDDVIVGGLENDRIVGGTGSDTLTGDAGADTFVFSPNFGKDIVTDFTSGTDFLEIDHTLFNTIQDVLDAAHLVGSNLVITYDANNTITLKNATLNASDIQLV